MAELDHVEAPILVPVDFSLHSEAALEWAARAAGYFRAPLNILHVVHDPADDPGYYHRNTSEAVVTLEERAREMLLAFVDATRRKHPDLEHLQDASLILVSGLPVNRIIETARECGAQLIVMGSRGLTGLPHLLLGSTAERVIQLATLPVTVIKANNQSSEA